MTDADLTLFGRDQLAAEPDAAPLCPTCGRPRRWLTTRDDWAPYCGGQNCNAVERLCKWCGATFNRHDREGGTLYCSTACREARTHDRTANRPRRGPACAWECGRRAAGPRVSAHPDGWVCDTCLAPLADVLADLRRHRVSPARLRRLIEDPSCEVCHLEQITTRTMQPDGRMIAALVVDHDHACCPVSRHSCGKCVRGLICRHCNALIGQARDRPDVCRSAADYLDRWEATRS